ncbi:MAG TPA: hypothetical protein VNH64_11610, partial [Parvularculaceae bacterium]|nr:hypothetical protein [Parvularculaceae bacterium]
MNKGLAVALFAAAALTTAGCIFGGHKASRTEAEASDDSANEKKPPRLSTRDKNNPAPCPNVIALADAARIIQFDGDESLENIAYTGEILGVHLECRYY